MLRPHGMNLRLLGMSLWSGVLMTGCISTGMARTLDQGKVQVTAAPGLQIAGNLLLPQVELGVRYGVTDRVDVGARLFGVRETSVLTGGGAVDTRIALKRTPTIQEPGIDLTLAPSVTYLRIGDNAQVFTELPLLIGLNPGEGYQVVLGPRVIFAPSFAPNLQVGTSVGSSLGIVIPLASWLHLVPELTARIQLQERSGMAFQGSVGVLIGGFEP